VCNNVILEMFRRGKRLSQLPEDNPDIPSGEIGVETDLLHQERQTRVREAIGQLSAQDQELLRRVLLNEEDKDTVCKEFEVTRSYLRVLLHRARTRLRGVLTQ
jgi:RNA polymerase sigma-70 factor (ECF subfamily)